MNHDTHNDTHDLPDALRWQLRGLRQDEAPAADLWPGIAQRLTPHARAAFPAPSGVRPPAAMAAWRWRMPVALAASVLVAVGTLGLLRYGGPSPGQSSSFSDDAGFAAVTDSAFSSDTAHATNNALITADTPLALAEAQALRLQYEGAIRELETRPSAAAANPTLRTLDNSAELILAALRQTPDSTRLLEQLRRTYQRRLDLMRLPLA
ncbi:anti-sigma factor [Aerolutibacter daejeonensis]|uniref:anti-sigma factor n=1 Tax=Aerolutibacter daejeonensis TaxID=346181 RepID=UPI000689BCE5|nr:anti-sigma factor [Lysobacter daejeonensis]